MKVWFDNPNVVTAERRMEDWTYIEFKGHRAHYVADSFDGCILVEFINGEREIWPRAECRVIGA